jgi:hypothetical protein
VPARGPAPQLHCSFAVRSHGPRLAASTKSPLISQQTPEHARTLAAQSSSDPIQYQCSGASCDRLFIVVVVYSIEQPYAMCGQDHLDLCRIDRSSSPEFVSFSAILDGPHRLASRQTNASGDVRAVPATACRACAVIRRASCRSWMYSIDRVAENQETGRAYMCRRGVCESEIELWN